MHMHYDMGGHGRRQTANANDCMHFGVYYRPIRISLCKCCALRCLLRAKRCNHGDDDIKLALNAL